jgi:chromosomal replication initiator protein
MRQEVFMDESVANRTLRSDLAGAIGRDRFDLWLGDEATIDCRDRQLVVELPSSFLRDQVQRRLGAQLQMAAAKLLGHGATVVVTVGASTAKPLSTTTPTSPKTTKAARAAAAPVAPSSHSSEPSSRPQTATMTFESLVVGGANELAVHAARQIASGRQSGGPLVLWGPAGCGKSHTLAAIRHAYRQRFPKGRVVSLTAEQFVGHYVDSIRGGGLPAFRMKYRGASLLLIDDLHFMGGKVASLDELLYTVDRLTAAGGQVVFASAREPGSISQLGSELLSRLRAGLVCEMRSADYAVRLEFTRRRAADMELSLEQQHCQLIAAGVSTGAREIIGTLNRLQAKLELCGLGLTTELVEETIAEITRQTVRPMAMGEIEQAVCSYFGVEAKDLRSGSRKQSVSQPRMLAMWLARKYTQAGWREIGAYFGGRSHSTVISAHRRVVEEMARGAKCAPGGGPLEDVVLRIETALRTA